MGLFNKYESLCLGEFGYMAKGMVRSEYFLLLIDLSSLRSFKSICALKEYLVEGRDLKDVCNKYGITPSYFTSSLRKLQGLNQNVICALPYYRH